MKIDTIFNEVRTIYFPRWNRKREWKIDFGSPEQLRDMTGYCDSKVKRIYLAYNSIYGMSDAGVRASVIHEICHDVRAASHNRRWVDRMEQAAATAKKFNENEVAEILRSDIFSYAGSGVRSKYDTSHVLEFTIYLIDNNPSIDFAKLVKRVAKHFGYSTRKIKKDYSNLILDAINVII
jgi:hypothetical protein